MFTCVLCVATSRGKCVAMTIAGLGELLTLADIDFDELRRGSQPSPWVGPGKPNLPLGLRGSQSWTRLSDFHFPLCGLGEVSTS